ncbi:MAG: tRNA lysidine(34) synthetase TilS [Campylobacteraceae bacterium]|nr:tRNA lysidine(34) synthetase TilS [Campylobacteraceae bacterium]
MSDEFVTLLKNKKNLLGFSAGVDSSALFFLLLQEQIPFDVACVNYQTRPNSSKEALHVENLAKKCGKISYIHTCKLGKSNFEKKARDERYEFFEQIINENGYENLLLAHQLDDRFEWFMMQFCKGAGISELSGFEKIEKRKNYNIIRPLWQNSKEELKAFLDENSHPYFIDESNFDTKYKRNFFRKNVSSPLLEKYKNGISKSLHFISEDAKILNGEFFCIQKELFVYKLQNELINIRLIDKAVKRLGFVMSESSRVEALKQNAVLSHSVGVGRNEKYGFIAPFLTCKMDKAFKERCRKAKIPLHVRAYMYKENLDPDKFTKQKGKQ